MSSATSAVTYTSVYTDSEPGRAFWGADDEEVSEGGIPRVIVLGYDGLPLQPVAPPSPDYIPGPENPQTPPVPQDEDEREPMFVQAHDPDYVPEPIYPEYIPLEDDHEFPAEEQPLPPIDSPTAESPGYVTESDPEEDPEEYEDDETEDGPVDYPMDGGDDGDDDDGDSSRDDANDEDEDKFNTTNVKVPWIKQRMNAASSVRRPMNRDSHVKNSFLANSKNSAKKVEVYVRKNKQTDNTYVNVISNNENENLQKQNSVSVFLTQRSSNTTNVVLKTRFSEKLTQSKSFDTTSVVSKPKIDVGSASKAKHKTIVRQGSFYHPYNSAAQPTQFHEDSSSTSLIIVEEHEAPPIETTSDEQTYLISLTNTDEVNLEDSANFNGQHGFCSI
ncbi:hypothetical protein Tco_0126578 [Tanacetum coccineum]